MKLFAFTAAAWYLALGTQYAIDHGAWVWGWLGMGVSFVLFIAAVRQS